MKIIVCGGRHFRDERRVYAVLDRLHLQEGISEVIEGGATGADALGREWAEHRGVPRTVVTADWETLGLDAGRIRNRKMLRTKPDAVVAFPGGRGTAHMVRIATEAGARVIQG
jgi:hypothetical protein